MTDCMSKRIPDYQGWRLIVVSLCAAMIWAVLLPAAVLLWAIDAVRNGR